MKFILKSIIAATDASMEGEPVSGSVDEAWRESMKALLGTVLKGGEGSGHKGHRGILGHHGGSLPGTATFGSYIDINMQEPGDPGYDRMCKALNVKKMNKVVLDSYVREMFNYRYTYKGKRFSAEVQHVYVDIEGIVHIEGIIGDEEGEEIGAFARVISYDENTGKRTVMHDGFKIDRDQQESGFGSSYFQFCEDNYIRQGFDTVKVHAGDTVGGYAWARLGFDFDQPIGGITARFYRYYRLNFPDVPVPTFTHPWELAMMVSPPGFPDTEHTLVGRDFLLGETWFGVKDITPGSINLKVGDAYYEAKRKAMR